jgi:hypothetical protein
MNKQTILLPSIQLTAGYTFLQILSRILASIFVISSNFKPMLTEFGLSIVILIIILIFAVKPELMWFKFENADRMQSKKIFEIGLLIIGVCLLFTALPKALEGLYMAFYYNVINIELKDMLIDPLRVYTVPAIQFIIPTLIIIRAKIVLKCRGK